VPKKTTKKKASRKQAAVPVDLAIQPCIKDIDAIKNDLNSARASGAPIVIDASKVETIDTAILQLLVAFSNAVRERAVPIEWRDPSASFIAQADLCDLSSHLRLTSIPVAAELAADGNDLCPVF